MTPSVAIKLGEALMRIRPAPLAALLKKVLCVRRFPHSTPHGTYWVDPASYQGLELLNHGIYEPQLLATVESRLTPGSVFVDVGANEGYFSVAAARRVGPTGRVLAIEPQLRLEPVIRRNIELNALSNIELAQVAISDRPGTAELYLTPTVNNSASGLAAVTRYPLPHQSVTLATLEEMLSIHRIETCHLMKIDIEGWEHEAILGSRPLFTSGRVRSIALELHPQILAARQLSGTAISDFLALCGYRAVPDCGHLLLTLD